MGTPGFCWLRSSPPLIVSLTHHEVSEEKSMKPLSFSVHFQFRKIELISLLGAAQTSPSRQNKKKKKSLQRPRKPLSLKVTEWRLKAPPGRAEMPDQNKTLSQHWEGWAGLVPSRACWYFPASSGTWSDSWGQWMLRDFPHPACSGVEELLC